MKWLKFLYNSAPLYDIRIVGIPDSILLKPWKPTYDEFGIMKQHAECGGKALKLAIDRLDFDSFLNIAMEIALNHHGKWNGKGYSVGLKGTEYLLQQGLWCSCK